MLVALQEGQANIAAPLYLSESKSDEKSWTGYFTTGRVST